MTEPVRIVVVGTEPAREVEVTAPIIVGRETDGLKLPDAQVSRTHAEIRPLDGGAVITDLGSRNGTFVNGTRIERPVPLAGGDSILVGGTTLRVVAPARQDATVAATLPERAATTMGAGVGERPIVVAVTVPLDEPAPPPPARQPGAPVLASATAPPAFRQLLPASALPRRAPASRRPLPMAAAVALIAATALALIVYFAIR